MEQLEERLPFYSEIRVLSAAGFGREWCCLSFVVI